MEEETEAQFVNKVVIVLQKYFKVEREVWSDCRGGRIDLILTTKEGYRFGVECKRFDKKKGEKIGRYIKQAMRYSTYNFSNERIPIFIAPPLSYKYFIMNDFEDVKENGEKWHKDRHYETHEHHSFNGFLGVFNVGEIRTFEKGFFYFSFCNKIIWDSSFRYNTKTPKGIHKVNYENLIKKINS